MDSGAHAPVITGRLVATTGVGAVAPPWWEQITPRGLAVSMFLGVLFSLITHKLNLSVGIVPSLNVAAGMLGYFFMQMWVAVQGRLLANSKPFTKQENTVIQTCIVACCNLAAGLGNYVLAMDHKTYELVGTDYPGNRPEDVKNSSLGWIIGFMFAVSFVGLFSLVPLRKAMIIDYKLTYPSGTATAMLINSFHTSGGSELAKGQVSCLGKYLSISFMWNCFKWFFSGVGGACGFDNFPSLGLAAFKNTFYFDFNLSYVGYGLLCPHVVNCSALLGAIISWGLLWPYISAKAGEWYPSNLGSHDFRGLYGYKVFVSVSLILGDGLYNFIKIVYATTNEILKKRSQQGSLPNVHVHDDDEDSGISVEEKLRNELFSKDRISPWLAGSGYVGLAAISTAIVPLMFPQLKWYFILMVYVVGPLLAFCNSYGTGLTDYNLSSTYGKIALFIFSSLVGQNGGVIAGLAACGVMMSIVSTAADLMQDFKTGYLTHSSPRSLFVSQLLGTTLGCIVAPLTFWLYWMAFNIGDPEGTFKAPNAVIYREMSILGVAGISALPQHCLSICSVFFASAIVINILRDTAPKNVSKFMPIPMAMAIPFYIGAYFVIDMFAGTVILFIWERVNRKHSEDFAGPVASGLICGDGIWSIPSAILSMLSVNPPICMCFKPSLPS